MIINEYIIQLIGIIMTFSSVLVITSVNPVHSVLYLILVFLNASAILIVLQTEFLAMIFIIVYVGAIAVLFLFVIMMLNIKITLHNSKILNYIPIGIILLSIFSNQIILLLLKQRNNIELLNIIPNNIHTKTIQYIDWINLINLPNNIQSIGNIIYTYYYDIFLISGIILLVAMNGAIALTLYKNFNIKKQLAFKQILRIGELNLYK